MRPWAELTPQQRAQAREQFKTLKQLPPEKKDEVRQKWEQYQSLPPETRRELAAKPVPATPPGRAAPAAPSGRKPAPALAPPGSGPPPVAAAAGSRPPPGSGVRRPGRVRRRRRCRAARRRRDDGRVTAHPPAPAAAPAEPPACPGAGLPRAARRRADLRVAAADGAAVRRELRAAAAGVARTSDFGADRAHAPAAVDSGAGVHLPGPVRRRCALLRHVVDRRPAHAGDEDLAAAARRSGRRGARPAPRVAALPRRLDRPGAGAGRVRGAATRWACPRTSSGSSRSTGSGRWSIATAASCTTGSPAPVWSATRPAPDCGALGASAYSAGGSAGRGPGGRARASATASAITTMPASAGAIERLAEQAPRHQRSHHRHQVEQARHVGGRAVAEQPVEQADRAERQHQHRPAEGERRTTRSSGRPARRATPRPARRAARRRRTGSPPRCAGRDGRNAASATACRR